jgi:hypothetical protein
VPRLRAGAHLETADYLTAGRQFVDAIVPMTSPGAIGGRLHDLGAVPVVEPSPRAPDGCHDVEPGQMRQTADAVEMEMRFTHFESPDRRTTSGRLDRLREMPFPRHFLIWLRAAASGNISHPPTYRTAWQEQCLPSRPLSRLLSQQKALLRRCSDDPGSGVLHTPAPLSPDVRAPRAP